MARRFNSSDEGKEVVDSEGESIGTVERVSGNSAHIMPEQGLSQRLRERLGWDEEGEETYMLPHDRVKEITDDEIQLAEL